MIDTSIKKKTFYGLNGEPTCG